MFIIIRQTNFNIITVTIVYKRSLHQLNLSDILEVICDVIECSLNESNTEGHPDWSYGKG